MQLIWILFAMPAGILLYLAWVLGWQKPTPYSVPLAPANPSSNVDRGAHSYNKRRVSWISSTEVGALAHRFEAVIVIDLLSGSRGGGSLFPEDHFLFICPHEFWDVLRWAPSSSCVVLYGPSSLCKSMLRAVRDIHSDAPVFVVAVDLGIGK
jgi:hypothetical protein